MRVLGQRHLPRSNASSSSSSSSGSSGFPHYSVSASWEIHWSAEYQRPYFWNSRTGDSLWDRPTGVSFSVFRHPDENSGHQSMSSKPNEEKYPPGQQMFQNQLKRSLSSGLRTTCMATKAEKDKFEVSLRSADVVYKSKDKFYDPLVADKEMKAARQVKAEVRMPLTSGNKDEFADQNSKSDADDSTQKDADDSAQKDADEAAQKAAMDRAAENKRENLQRIAKTSVQRKLDRMLKNPPVRDGQPIAKRRVRRASRGWMKAAMHKIKPREDKDQKRKERTAKLVASGKYDADEETRQAWKRHRQSSEAFGLNDDGTPREGAGVQGLPQYKIKKKTSIQRRNQMNRAKVRNEEKLKATSIENIPTKKSYPWRTVNVRTQVPKKGSIRLEKNDDSISNLSSSSTGLPDAQEVKVFLKPTSKGKARRTTTTIPPPTQSQGERPEPGMKYI